MRRDRHADLATILGLHVGDHAAHVLALHKPTGPQVAIRASRYVGVSLGKVVRGRNDKATTAVSKEFGILLFQWALEGFKSNEFESVVQSCYDILPRWA